MAFLGFPSQGQFLVRQVSEEELAPEEAKALASDKITTLLRRLEAEIKTLATKKYLWKFGVPIAAGIAGLGSMLRASPLSPSPL